MKSFDVKLFLNHKQISSCQRIMETRIRAQDVNQAQYLALKLVTDNDKLSEYIPDNKSIQDLGWNKWGRSDRWGKETPQIESEWFKGGFKSKYDVCFRIWLREYTYEEPKSCPTCGRYYD